ncbi:putative C2H2-type domain-containing protein [Seiridium cardinale]|uniref:C2H2-type domain-containing protein n=1 Tax=Seiridium cardinale TaxID=138064 RepID=A0ABR2XHP5_9PEZI
MEPIFGTRVTNCFEKIEQEPDSRTLHEELGALDWEEGSSSRGLPSSPVATGLNHAAGKKKRGRDEDQNDSHDGRETFNARSGTYSPSDRQAPHNPTQHANLSCPYRKRNPSRFNVRDHQGCALTSYATYTLLKRHIEKSHQRKEISSPYFCQRCKERFRNQDEWEIHIRHWVCEFRPVASVDPEDGITEKIMQIFAARRRSQRVYDWPTLWRTLFPDDIDEEHLPSPDFIPPVEILEILEIEKRFPEKIHYHLMGARERLLSCSSDQFQSCLQEELASIIGKFSAAIIAEVRQSSAEVQGKVARTPPIRPPSTPGLLASPQAPTPKRLKQYLLSSDTSSAAALQTGALLRVSSGVSISGTSATAKNSEPNQASTFDDTRYHRDMSIPVAPRLDERAPSSPIPAVTCPTSGPSTAIEFDIFDGTDQHEDLFSQIFRDGRY